MKKLPALTQLELVLLQLVAKGNGNWSWYEIASHLSRLDVPREPDMMVVLKKLAAEGLLKRDVQPGSPRDRWELTATGVHRIKAKEAKPTKRKKISKRIPLAQLQDGRLKIGKKIRR